MARGLSVLLLYGQWKVNEFRVWVFESRKSYGLMLSSRTRYEELVDMVEKKLGVDVSSQRVNLSYCWPQFMLMDDGKDAPPVPIRSDADVDCFLSVRADLEQINLCATITDLSPNCHQEMVGSNSLNTSNLSSGDIVEQTNPQLDGNNGAMVVYQGLEIHLSTEENIEDMFMVPITTPVMDEDTSNEVQIAYQDKGKGKVGEEDIRCNNDLLFSAELGIGTDQIDVALFTNLTTGFEKGEGSNRHRCYAGPPWQTLYEELEGYCDPGNLNTVETNDPRPEIPIFDNPSTSLPNMNDPPPEDPIYNDHPHAVPNMNEPPNEVPIINDPAGEVPILTDTDEEDDRDHNSVMGSAMGNVENLIAEEFDPVEEFVWGSPIENEHDGGSPHGANVESLFVGRVFKHKADFRLQLSINAIKEKYTFKTLRSSPKQIEVVCICMECPWRIFSCIVEGGTEFEVRFANLVHSCSVDERRHYNKHATVEVLGELMMPRFVGGRRGPSPIEIQRLVHVEHQVQITYWNAWKCREIAMEKAVGSISGSYAMLPSYLSNLIDKNPGSICKLECDNDVTGERRFKHLFISYGASIKGLPFLRPVILVDGTHLKGRYGGCLLIASGQDGNFQTFPIAYAVVDSENDASYEWFFKCLLEVVDDHRHLVFISDRHPSINKALEKVYPQASHGACLVHLTRNVATKFSREKRLPGLVVRAGKAYTVFECAMAMAEIDSISPACREYLQDVGFTRWTRAYCMGDRYNLMNTNLAESLNNVLKECRGLPIVAMLEAIRLSLQGWFNKRRNFASRDNHSLTPRVRAMLEPIFDESHYMTIYRINEGEYEIHDRAGGKFFVNLHTKSCSCRFWDVEKIPCPHAMAAGHKENMMSEDMITEKYYQGYLQHTWAEGIYPFPAPVVTQPRVLPPWTKRPPGRPKKERYKSRVEMMKQSTNKRKCSRCKGRGHNKATCKKPLREKGPV